MGHIIFIGINLLKIQASCFGVVVDLGIFGPRLELPRRRVGCPLHQPARRYQGPARPPACHRYAMSNQAARRHHDHELKARHRQNVERDAPTRPVSRPKGVHEASQSPPECPTQNLNAQPWPGPGFAECHNYLACQVLGCPCRCGSKSMAPGTWQSVDLVARRSAMQGSSQSSSGNCSVSHQCPGS